MEFQDLRANGTIPSTALVWKEGMPNWVPASQLPGATTAPSRPPPPPLVQFGGAAPDLTQPALAAAEPGTLVKVARVLAVFSLFFTVFTGVPAIICAVIAMARPGQRRHATKALIWSIVCLALSLIVWGIVNYQIAQWFRDLR